MKLRRPCEHGKYDEHNEYHGRNRVMVCPGGVFLPDLDIETITAALFRVPFHGSVDRAYVERQAAMVLDVLFGQEPDPNQLEVPFKNVRGAW